MKHKWTRAALAVALAISLAVPAAAEELVQHEAYISGFPDGTIRPEALLTREQLAAMLYRMLTDEAREAMEGRDTCFADVPPDRWSYRAVTAAAELGVLFGDQRGYFHPEEGISGPDLALALNLLAHTRAAAEALPELSEGWNAMEATFAAGNGWVMGFDGKAFRPEDPLTRGEAVQILNGLLGRTPETLEDLLVGMPLWSDNLDAETWYFLDLQEAAVTHTACISGASERWQALG